MTGFSTIRSQPSEAFFEKRPIRGTQASKPHFNCSTFYVHLFIIYYVHRVIPTTRTS